MAYSLATTANIFLERPCLLLSAQIVCKAWRTWTDHLTSTAVTPKARRANSSRITKQTTFLLDTTSHHPCTLKDELSFLTLLFSKKIIPDPQTECFIQPTIQKAFQEATLKTLQLSAMCESSPYILKALLKLTSKD